MRALSGMYLLVVAAVLVWVFREYMPTCTLISGSPGGIQKQCKCTGYELVLRDDLDAGGIRKTMCIGVAEVTECFMVVDDELIPSLCN